MRWRDSFIWRRNSLRSINVLCIITFVFSMREETGNNVNVPINKNKSNFRFYFTSFYVHVHGWLEVEIPKVEGGEGDGVVESFLLVKHGLRDIPFAASSSFRWPPPRVRTAGRMNPKPASSSSHRRCCWPWQTGKWREEAGGFWGGLVRTSVRQRVFFSRSKCVNSKVRLFIMKSDGLLMHTSCF